MMMEDQEHTSRSSLAFANSTTLQQFSGDPNVLFNVTIHPDEDWTILTDPVERRRVQNRIAQRGYRNRLKNSKKASAASNKNTQSGSCSPSHSGTVATPKEKKDKDYCPPTSRSSEGLKPKRQNSQFNSPAVSSSEPVSTHHHYVRKPSSPVPMDWPRARETSNQSLPSSGQQYQGHNNQYYPYLHSPPLAMDDIHVHDMNMSPFNDLNKQPAFIDPGVVSSGLTRPGLSMDSYPTSYESLSETNSQGASGCDIKDFKHVDGGTALHRAAFYGHESVVETLLEGGADPEARNRYGLSTLHLVALKGHQGLVRLLLDQGADGNARNRAGKTPLHLAAKRDERAVVRLLLQHKRIDVNARDLKGQTSLHVASEQGHQAVVRLLLEKGADIDMKDDAGLTALHQASVLGREAIVKLLLENGADIHAKSDKG